MLDNPPPNKYERGRAFALSWVVISVAMLVLGIYVWIAKGVWLVLACAIVAAIGTGVMYRANERYRDKEF